MCLTDENEVFIWGKNILDAKNQQVFVEPTLICKIDEQHLNVANDDNQVLDKIFAL